MRVSRIVGAAFLCAMIATPAVAQQVGNVVYVSPKHGTGISIIGDFARGLNDASGKTNYFGGRAILSLPLLTLSAGVGVVKADDALDPGAESEITFGGLASLNVISAPLMPVAVAVRDRAPTRRFCASRWVPRSRSACRRPASPWNRGLLRVSTSRVSRTARAAPTPTLGCREGSISGSRTVSACMPRSTTWRCLPTSRASVARTCHHSSSASDCTTRFPCLAWGCRW